MSLISSPLDFLSFTFTSAVRRNFNDIFDPTFFNFVEIFGSYDICFVTALRPALLDEFGMLENVLCLTNGVGSFSVREKAAANRLVRLDPFLEGLRTNANISRITLVFSFFSGTTTGSGSFGGQGSLGDLAGDVLPELHADFNDVPHVSDGFDIVIGGIGS